MALRSAATTALEACFAIVFLANTLPAQSAGPGTIHGWRSPRGGNHNPAETEIQPRDPITPTIQQIPNAGPATTALYSELQPANPASRASLATVEETTPPSRARVTKGSGTLPNNHGQIWREYDISPYTQSVTTSTRPEQAVIDWILRETGYEAWHSEPLGILSADRNTLRVYHTPEMQSVAADIVDRFVSSQAKARAFGLRIASIRNPNWRSKAMRLTTPVPVQSSGVQGWLLAKEDAALLISELRLRTDYREHNAPDLLVHNGQSTVISTMRQRTYTKNIIPTNTAWPGYQPEMGVLDEGFSLEFSPLVSLDGKTVDAIIKLRLNQIEKMVPVQLDVPTQVAPNQQAQIEVPQMTMCDLHERFRWPVDRVLLLSMGVVAIPEPVRGNLLTDAFPLAKSPPRADALLLIESKGGVRQIDAAAATARQGGSKYHGRY
ncbi:MAG: hypothetical protein JW829_20500 [Pirellulales bacterium]|nr:hypothetical protein [Pirellulales bacterium]